VVAAVKATPASRAIPSWRASLLAGAGGLLLAPTLLRPGAHGPVLCPLRRVTGLWCPSCGMTRAFGWLAHGDFDQAVRYHPLAPVLLIEGIIVAALWAGLRRAPRHVASRSPLWMSAARVLIVANAVLVLVVWAIRLKSGSFDDLG
jgi:hypothetical protein